MQSRADAAASRYDCSGIPNGSGLNERQKIGVVRIGLPGGHVVRAATVSQRPRSTSEVLLKERDRPRICLRRGFGVVMNTLVPGKCVRAP
jgi:hypothetical protein